MDLLYKKERKAPTSSLYVKRVREPVLDINWHFHEEYEIIYIIKGSGVRLIGDNLSNFQSKELVLVGPNIPHLWRTTENMSSVDRIIIKFEESPTGISMFSLPEFSRIKSLLDNSSTGISFPQEVICQVHQQIIEISEAKGAAQWIYLLQVLTKLAESKGFKELSSPFMEVSVRNHNEDRLSKVINYISENYSMDVSLEKVADIASMTTPSFCRYFKKRTNKTFVQFLNEYRIGKACVQLIENKLPISEIWNELGFNSSTNFNRLFKRMYGCSPLDYRKKAILSNGQ